jgi:hypothetical protein
VRSSAGHEERPAVRPSIHPAEDRLPCVRSRVSPGPASSFKICRVERAYGGSILLAAVRRWEGLRWSSWSSSMRSAMTASPRLTQDDDQALLPEQSIDCPPWSSCGSPGWAQQPASPWLLFVFGRDPATPCHASLNGPRAQPAGSKPTRRHHNCLVGTRRAVFLAPLEAPPFHL